MASAIVPWEISELPSNTQAISFWRRVISQYCERNGGRWDETTNNAMVRQIVDTKRALT